MTKRVKVKSINLFLAEHDVESYRDTNEDDYACAELEFCPGGIMIYCGSSYFYAERPGLEFTSRRFYPYGAFVRLDFTAELENDQ